MTVHLYDTAGQEKVKNITQNYYKNANGVIVVFDITRYDSFESAKEYLMNVVEQNPHIVKFLCGNKCDS